jgi:phosphate transport system permease protein
MINVTVSQRESPNANPASRWEDGMARAFGEALAVQMVIGNATLMPNSLVTPASTLTSILTMSMGNTVMGTLENNVLWSLATILLLMALFFNILTRYIGKKGAVKK